MIPKKIHYCWFGKNPKPELAIKCINSWKNYCPDYELIEWNENNFDIQSNQYVREAYQAKKYAFVSDYVRLYALYNHGGIYMDTDVELLKNLDNFLQFKAVSGFENDTQILTGLMACQKNFSLFHHFLSYYDYAKFINDDGSFNLTTNVITITNMMLDYEFIPNGQFQIVKDFALFPRNIFCPDHKLLNNKQYMKDTVSIHFFAGSWKSEKTKKREASSWWKVVSFLGPKLSKLLTCIFGDRWVKFKRSLINWFDK